MPALRPGLAMLGTLTLLMGAGLASCTGSGGEQAQGGEVQESPLVGDSAVTAGWVIRPTEADVLAAHPDARRQPHKYVDGSYLIALPRAPADTVHRYVYETDGARVTGYRAGVAPQVHWVEGCS